MNRPRSAFVFSEEGRDNMIQYLLDEFFKPCHSVKMSSDAFLDAMVRYIADVFATLLISCHIRTRAARQAREALPTMRVLSGGLPPTSL